MIEGPRGPFDDAALVREVAGGSYDALAALYDRHATAIYAVASRLTSDRGVAEEVVQDTFLALWDRAESFDPRTGSLPAWLHTIARNRTVDRLRSAGRRPQLAGPHRSSTAEDSETQILERAAAIGTIVGGSQPPTGPEDALASKETRATIDLALGTMAVEERTVIVLAYHDGLSQSEIAERLGWPLGTVKTRTRRALRRLRDALDEATGMPAHVGEDG
jgi:RNA polymerase sigma-70 factor, ECF subfamily